MDKSSRELKHVTYEILIVALSLLSFINIPLYYLMRDETTIAVVATIDAGISIIFLVDFIYRLWIADSKKEYFFHRFGWADLLASLPFPAVKLLRAFRLYRVARLMRQIGPERLLRELRANRGGNALVIVLLLIILILEFGSIGIVAAERSNPDANIKNASDALWWVYVSITTVGYGDRFPVTMTGRLIGIFVLTLGVGLFGVLTGFLADFFLNRRSDDQSDTLPQMEAPSDVKEKMNELKRLLEEQKQAQTALEVKIAEIEKLI